VKVPVTDEALPGTPPDATQRPSVLRGLARTARPHQWTKNVLVGAAPLAAGKVFHGSVLVHTVLAFIAFCLAASGTYLVNDALDVEADRLHPTKRNRPVAAGVVPVPLAIGTGAVLMAGAIGLALGATTGRFALVLVAYVGMTLAYSLWLKHQPVIDLACVSGGFTLRAAGGGTAASLHISRWFLIVSAFGALFMIAGKRYAELLRIGEGSHHTRKALAGYTLGYLRFVWEVAVAIMIMAYCLWAFEVDGHHRTSTPWALLSVVPFVLAVLRYALDVEAGRAESPDRIVLSDRGLQALGIAWAALFALGAFGV
jgi:decaprenyl-phosphate phosphoribosyltransferase